MKQVLRHTCLWLALLFTGPAIGQIATPATTLTELRERLTAQLQSPRFAAGVFGVKIVSLDTGRTLFEQEAGKLLSPASNCKLYTVALALDQLGGDYRIRTSLYAAGSNNQNGTLEGDLIIYGRGAPDFNARLHGNDLGRALLPLVAALTNAGLRRVTGDLIGDESFFRGPPWGSGWAWDDAQYYYGAEISALTLDDNTLRLTVRPGSQVGAPCRLELSPATEYASLSNRTATVAAGGRRGISLYRPAGGNVTYVSGTLPVDGNSYSDVVTLHRPAQWFAEFFRDELKRHGVAVAGRARAVDAWERDVKPLDWGKLIELGAVESLPLRTLAREVQKPSQNLYTDLLLAHVGALAGATNAAARETAEDAGVRELTRFLTRIGIPRDDFRLEEGSGLSRNNVVTANATITLLQHMSRHAQAAAFLDALPIAGVDGTLRNRMKDTAAAGNVRAKTGTLRWANALSGHVTSAAGERLIFSLMLNRYIMPSAEFSARGELDRLAVLLAEFKGRSDE